MQKLSAQPSVLYIVATPIGNLSDISKRALEILASVDFVLCEDTRHSGALLEHFGIHQKLVSYFAHNEALRTDQFLPRLIDGGSAAMITDAGTPGISDPGARLVDACLEHGVKICPVPGASAVVNAVASSGFYQYTRFEFVAFFPRKTNERIELFESLCHRPSLTVGYESPQRVCELLDDLEKVVGPQRRICLCRELTKKFETIERSTLCNLRNSMRENSIRGEICLVIDGEMPRPASNDNDELSHDAAKLADVLIRQKISARDVRDIVAAYCGCRPKLVYQYVLDHSV